MFGVYGLSLCCNILIQSTALFSTGVLAKKKKKTVQTVLVDELKSKSTLNSGV